MTMGFYELCLENNLRELKVYNEVYFGQDSYVGNSMHKIYKNFLNGESKLIDMFQGYPELHSNLNISANHQLLRVRRQLLLKMLLSSQKKLPFYFPEVSITRKMHLMGFVISPLIANDKTDNICYKYLKLEQMGERLHAIWNLLHRTRTLILNNLTRYNVCAVIPRVTFKY